MSKIKIIIQQHPDGFVAYPIGMKGVIIGQGDSADEAYQDVLSAIRFHLESFGEESLNEDPPVLDAFLKEAQL